jgi:hypothetical protein
MSERIQCQYLSLFNALEFVDLLIMALICFMYPQELAACKYQTQSEWNYWLRLVTEKSCWTQSCFIIPTSNERDALICYELGGVRVTLWRAISWQHIQGRMW